MKVEMWEIMVPITSNEGNPFRTRYHKVWDEKVRSIAGGLTILKPAKGQWVNVDSKLYAERMIPVRIACTRQQIDKIIDITLKYYNQEAVLAIKISEEVILKYKDEKII